MKFIQTTDQIMIGTSLKVVKSCILFKYQFRNWDTIFTAILSLKCYPFDINHDLHVNMKNLFVL